jgi:hypothetical protein
MKRAILIFAVIGLLTGCGGGSVPVEKIAEKLGKLKANTADTPYSVKLDNTVNINTKRNDINKAIKAEGKYVILDLSECSATDNTLPEMSIIGDNAFLVGIVLPKSLTTIAEDAFDGCQYLTNITIPALVTSISGEIPGGAFDGCGKLANITVAAANPAFSSVDGALFDKGKTTLILFPAGKSGSYTIPSTVTGIGYTAFMGSQLTSVVIPDSVTAIEGYTFMGSQLTSVVIPNSVTAIGDSAFSGSQLTSVAIPDSVTVIGSSAFENNQLTSVTIPDSVTTIPGGAFYDNQLTSITIGSNVSIVIGTTHQWNWDSVKGSIGSRSFEILYNNDGKQAGTYTRPNVDSTTWTRQ